MGGALRALSSSNFQRIPQFPRCQKACPTEPKRSQMGANRPPRNPKDSEVVQNIEIYYNYNTVVILFYQVFRTFEHWMVRNPEKSRKNPTKSSQILKKTRKFTTIHEKIMKKSLKTMKNH